MTVMKWSSICYVKVKVKEVGLYSAFIVVPHTQGAHVRIIQCYLQITPYLLLPHKHSPDSASPDWGCGHLIAAHYSFVYPERMKGWVGLLADLQPQVERRTAKVRLSLTGCQRLTLCQSGAWLTEKRDQWHTEWMAQISPCMYLCHKRTFKHLLWLTSTHM